MIYYSKKKFFFDYTKETLRSSYVLLNKEIKELFKKNWGLIYKGDIKPHKQKNGGSVNFIKDFNNLIAEIGQIDWDVKLIDFKNQYENK